MGRSEMEHTRVDFRGLRYGAIRLGNFLNSHIEVSADAATQQGIRTARTALEDGGLIVLDAHRKFGDIIATGIELSKHIDITTFVAAVSAYDFQHWFVRRRFFRELGNIPGVELYPVFRDDDKNDPKRRRYYEKTHKNNISDVANIRRYFRRSIETVNSPHHVLLVAAYNGVGRMEKKGLSKGAALLLKHGSPALCTLTMWSWRDRMYRVYVSDSLLRFSGETDGTHMHDAILARHRLLLGRSESYKPS